MATLEHHLSAETDGAPASVLKGLRGQGMVMLMSRNVETAKRDLQMPSGEDLLFTEN